MKVLYIPAIFILMMTLVGCNTPTVEENPGFIKSSTLDDSHPRARLVLGSKSLVGKVRMSNVRFRKVGQLTQSQFSVQNLSNERIHLEYRIEWESMEGFIVDQSGVWRQIILSPTQIETLSAVGKKPDADKIIINLRNPDDPFSYEGKTDSSSNSYNDAGEL